MMKTKLFLTIHILFSIPCISQTNYRDTIIDKDILVILNYTFINNTISGNFDITNKTKSTIYISKAVNDPYPFFDFKYNQLDSVLLLLGQDQNKLTDSKYLFTEKIRKNDNAKFYFEFKSGTFLEFKTLKRIYEIQISYVGGDKLKAIRKKHEYLIDKNDLQLKYHSIIGRLPVRWRSSRQGQRAIVLKLNLLENDKNCN